MEIEGGKNKRKERREEKGGIGNTPIIMKVNKAYTHHNNIGKKSRCPTVQVTPLTTPTWLSPVFVYDDEVGDVVRLTCLH